MMVLGEDPGMQSFTTADAVSSLEHRLNGLAQPIAILACRSELERVPETRTPFGDTAIVSLEDLHLRQNFDWVFALVALAPKGRF